jgi:hypothetical protein
MFIAGLHEPIRNEIMKCTYTNFQAIDEVALYFEIIQQDNKAAKPMTVAAIGNPSLPPPASTDMTRSKPSMVFMLVAGRPHCFALPMEEPQPPPMDTTGPQTII